ncbi:UNVERIFIED_CONTAM: hypothetical protein Sradi_6950000 [Sesamum radiatum]|uniref:Uncharacterized protein n=1 Tax=Sesamum radiatum TaxID=300843 RepID=A0AAW2JFU2_SESRA
MSRGQGLRRPRSQSHGFLIAHGSWVISLQLPSIAELMVIFCDNNGAIAQVKESRSHHRSKHILRRYHLLREMVGRRDARMDRVTSAESMSDPLTKPVLQIAHAQHLGKMDLRNMSDWL